MNEALQNEQETWEPSGWQWLIKLVQMLLDFQV